jgi:ABC-type lipoprotein export system ATPase subunit
LSDGRRECMYVNSILIGKEILYAVETHRVVIIVGQTGSGKTTQIPQYLHEAGWTAGNRIIGCTQVSKAHTVNELAS